MAPGYEGPRDADAAALAGVRGRVVPERVVPAHRVPRGQRYVLDPTLRDQRRRALRLATGRRAIQPPLSVFCMEKHEWNRPYAVSAWLYGPWLAPPAARSARCRRT
jgi:hypothetical protein